MLEIGKQNRLVINKEVDFGLYLDDGYGREILLPKRYVPEDYTVGEEIDVFVYLDSEDLRIATTEIPYAMVGDFAYLNVVATSRVGAFMDWGLMKDLLVPFSEQKIKLKQDSSYVAYVYFDDKTGRIVASTKLNKFFDTDVSSLKEGQEVDLLIYDETELGYSAVINNKYKGLLFKNEVFQKLKEGKKISGYIKNIRPDGKIDLRLQKAGYDNVDDSAQLILDKIKQNSDYLPLNDKSKAETIYQMLKMSKKTFKKAVGQLYKKRLIKITDKGIKLND
jgi:predicted RNA-binding protein (virulence factor B family)